MFGFVATNLVGDTKSIILKRLLILLATEKQNKKQIITQDLNEFEMVHYLICTEVIPHLRYFATYEPL